eukprot:COSAG06_NODE_2771_length_6311_cov_12.386671_9_plen_46_part_00
MRLPAADRRLRTRDIYTLVIADVECRADNTALAVRKTPVPFGPVI